MTFTGCSNEQAERIYGGIASASSVGAHGGTGRASLLPFTGARRESGLWERTVCHIRGGERSNWALVSLKQGPVENKERTIPLDGREARVRISSVTKEGNTWKGKISSDGVDLQTKVMRFVKITFTVEDSGERKIMVESVESDR